MDRLRDDRRDLQPLDNLLLKNTRVIRPQITNRPEEEIEKQDQEKPEFLTKELRRLYGVTGEDKLMISAQKPPISKFLLGPIDDDFPKQNRVIKDILRDRQNEFENQQEQFQERLKSLNQERKKLLEAQENIKRQQSANKQRELSAPYSQKTVTPDWTFTWKALPPPREPGPSAVPAHSVDSIIDNIKKTYPKQKEQYYFMRKNHEAEIRRLQKLNAPYKGEFGIQTYKKSQLETYTMVRSLVESEIDRFLDNLFQPVVQAYSKNVQQALIWADEKETEKYRKALLHDNLSQLISEQLLFDVTRKLTVEAVKEFFYICAISTNISDKLLMNTAEVIATGREDGRDDEDPMYSTVTRLYFTQQQDRRETRDQMWRHHQYVHLVGETQGEEIEADEPGLDYVEFNQITPSETKSTKHHNLDSDEQKDNKDRLQRYRNYEINYWKNVTGKLFTISIHKHCRGICTARISHNHKFLAVGTYHGDVMVYDLRVFPWKAVRAVYNTNTKIEDPVIDIQWSMDGSQLITINLLGTLNLWSFNAGSISKDDLKGLGLGQPDPAGFYCAQLIRQIEMDVDDSDFSYVSGPLEMMGVHNDKFGPTLSCFHPSITFLGTQRSFCVALENGDILKCDVESRLHNDVAEYQETPRIYQDNVRPGIPSYLGANVEAELFRQHSHPVIFVGFVDNLNDMVSVDSKGYVNYWKYQKNSVTEYNWFKPQKRMRFRHYKLMYSPVGSAKPNIIFSDRNVRGQSVRTIYQERQKAERVFAETRLQNPWHSELLPEQKLRTTIYKPEGVIPEAGSLFHIISRHLQTDQISTYITRMYQPVKVAYARFYGVKQSPCGGELVVLKLFPAHAPKRAHFTVLRFNLQTLKMVDFRKDIFLSEEDYELYLKSEVVHWDFTRVYGPTGSDYLFLCRNGILEAYSMATGQQVLKIIDPKQKPPDTFPGCKISSKILKLSPNSRLVCAGTRGHLYIGFYEKLQDSIRVFQIVDNNTDVQRRNMWTVFSQLPGRRHVAKEQRVNIEDFYLEDLQHPRCYARNILLEAMDAAMAKSKKGGAKTVTDEIVAQDQVDNYEAIRPHVAKLASQAGGKRSRARGDDLLLSDEEMRPERRPSELESMPSERDSYRSYQSQRSRGQGSQGSQGQGSQGSLGQQSQRSQLSQGRAESQGRVGSQGQGASGGQGRASGGQGQASGGQGQASRGQGQGQASASGGQASQGQRRGSQGQGSAGQAKQASGGRQQGGSGGQAKQASGGRNKAGSAGQRGSGGQK